MMGQFGSEQWDCDGQDGYQRLDQVFQRVLSSKPKKMWWECWVRLAVFPLKIVVWCLAMVVAAVISILFVLPVLIGHYSWKRLRKEVQELVQSFRE
jgi:hypothetical protein